MSEVRPIKTEIIGVNQNELVIVHEKLNMAKDYLKKISKCEGQAWVRLDESVKMTVQFYAKEGLEQIGRIKD